jgi:hypothetical protein
MFSPKSVAWSFQHEVVGTLGYPRERRKRHAETTEPSGKSGSEGADLIHSYGRRQAIKDGVLIDVTTTAKEVGFCFPVAVTAALWSQYVRVPDAVEGQDEAGRLWDILGSAIRWPETAL